MEHLKFFFGSQYMKKTLAFIEQANLSWKKAVAYGWEWEMDARAKAFPDNVGIQNCKI
jgi:hypothetical protein